MNFQLGQPFRPFQQLMGVLPDRSKKIVPTAYHDLMINPDSPIIDFYPRDFELDMNGKQMAWEAVVKIPFIDEQRLLSAMATKDHLLSEDERQRNDWGVTVKFGYAPEVDFIYPSSLPGIFPDLPHCKCIENIWELPTMEGLDYHVGLLEGVKLGDSALAGFPSLKVLPFAGALGFHGVSVFQQESRRESMIITLVDSDQRGRTSKAVERLGKPAHVGYPFLQEGKVVRVSDELFSYTLDESSDQVVRTPHGPTDIANWKKKADRLESFYSKRLAIITGSVECLIHVDILKGMKKMDDGSTVKDYGQVSGIETDYAAQTIVESVISEDQRFLEQDALPIEEEFPEGTSSFCLGDFQYGRPAKIAGHSNGKVEIWVLALKATEREFGRQIAVLADQRTPYIASYAVAKRLSLHPLTLSKITSSFSVMSGSQRLNLGLNLKFEAKKLKVLGYSRRGPNGWEFSQKAIELIEQYMIKFPDFIVAIQRHPTGDMFNDTDFYPEDIAKQKMKEISSWLKSIESKTFEKVPLNAEQLDSELVMEIERAADQLMQTSKPPEAKLMKNVPRHALLKPSDAMQRLGIQHFILGDRVVYVADSGKVPIASRGTIVGVTQTARTTLLDVVFDSSFMGGTTLGERCSPFRGATVPVGTVLNLTNKQLVATSKAMADRKTPTTANGQDYSKQSYQAQGMYGMPGGQYREASAPPPLAGSYKSALGGGQHTNGFDRGSGGRGRGGYDIATGLHQQNRQPQQQLPFRPQQANNAPTTEVSPSNNNNTLVPRGGSRGGLGYAASSPRGSPHQSRRGGYTPNRQGYVVIDNADPMEGVKQHNPDFRPRSYASVPPPADFGRGSVRGGGIGDGGGFRGGGGGQRWWWWWV